jgi:group II intron reverse transcriptase/maturase
MHTNLLGIANKAKKDKRHRFRNLYGMLNAEFLMGCWKDINKNAAMGVDKVSAAEYGINLSENVNELVSRLKAKRYQAKHIRRHYIPKSGDKLRPLGIPVTEDKLLQLGAKKILEAIYEQDFLPCSFGYRPGVSAHDALDDIDAKLQFGRYNYVVEADIKGYFDNIDHEWLIKMLALRIDDKPFLQLIRKWLKAGVLELNGEVIDPDKGSPQGGVVSPVLANIYLHYALDLWFEKKAKRYCHDEAMLIRYCDDWLCAFQSEYDAQRFFKAVKLRLRKFNLELAEEKTRMMRFSRFKSHKSSFEFLGFEFRWGKARTGKPHLKRRTAPKRFRRSVKTFTDWCKKSRHMKISAIVQTYASKLRGYYNYFGIIGNAKQLSKFHYVSTTILFEWLNRRSGKRSYTWAGFNDMLHHFQVPQPHIRQRTSRVTA